jgi:hypothetical protein
MTVNQVVVVRRICRRCAGEFTFKYYRGRPREYCFACLPEGCRWIGKSAARKVAA